MLNEKLKYYRNIKGGANDANGANGNGGNKANGNSGTNAEVEAIIAANNNNTEKSNSKKYGLLDDLLNFPGFKKLMGAFSEPCLVLPSEVRDKYHEDALWYMKRVQTFAKLETMGSSSALNTPGTLVIFKTVIGEFLSFFLFNPFLYWTNSKDKSKWGNRLGGMLVVRNALSKFLYCFLKIFGSPMILLFFAIGLFFYFLKALNIIELGKTIGQIILFVIGGVLCFTIIFAPVGVPMIEFAWKIPNTEHYEVDPITKEIIRKPNATYMLFGGAIIRLIGLIVPLQLYKPVWGKNYGYGGIGILILIFTIISGLIIFLGGINILFIGGIFLAYIAKVMSGLSSTQQK